MQSDGQLCRQRGCQVKGFAEVEVELIFVQGEIGRKLIKSVACDLDFFALVRKASFRHGARKGSCEQVSSGEALWDMRKFPRDGELSSWTKE